MHFGDYLAEMWTELLEKSKATSFIKIVPVLNSNVNDVSCSERSYEVVYSEENRRQKVKFFFLRKKKRINC